jgi:uncharacterized repeat protein (TIGR01451 family)
MSTCKRLLLLLPLLLLLFMPAAASATTPGPGWTIDSFATPTNFQLGDGSDQYTTIVTDAGARPANGSAVTVTDVVPSGLAVGAIHFYWSGLPVGFGGPETDLGGSFCKSAATVSGTEVECHLGTEEFSLPPISPDQTLKLLIGVSVESGAAGGLPNTVTVSGGGAPAASASQPDVISATPPPFGVSAFSFYIAGQNGAADTSAGDHPYELTTRIALDSEIRTAPDGAHEATSVQDLKDVVVDLPLGFAGSTLAAPQCTLGQLSGESCPADTVVGHILTEPQGAASVNSPIYNLVPERGVPGEFGYTDVLKGSHVFYVRVVPTPEGYVLQATNPDIPQVPLAHIVVTFFGDPTEKDGAGNGIPFFTDPTACSGGPLVATIWMDSWQHPGRVNADGTPDLEGDPNWVKDTSQSPAVTDCEELQFAPELKAQPTTNVADSPSGLEFELKLAQTEDRGVHATPALKTAVVTLPQGMTVDPSAGNGLGACSANPAAQPGSPGNQIGWLGPKGPDGEELPNHGLTNFSPDKPDGAGGCPENSKVGSLELETPLIGGVLHGELFLAAQNANPFGSTLAGYVVVNDPVTGVLLKIAGVFRANETTGQITAEFAENPQLPFSDLKLHFFGGPRAELTTPGGCATFTTSSVLSPWSITASELPATPFDNYTIDEGCVSGFNPSFAAGVTNLQAGAYSTFEASFSRQDTDQELGGLTVSLPPGLLADVASVPLCGEAQANAGACPESSRVGTVQAFAGPGPDPLAVAGRAYLTGPYNGGPYGLSVVVPAIAGPFNFGNVVVRQSLRIDPLSAAVTDVSNPFPTILDVTGANGLLSGIPIKLRRVDVSIDRPGFTFNPTDCSKLQVGGTISGAQGATSALATPFKVTNCATLKFTPKFSVSTSGKTSKADGASLTAKLTEPNEAQGSQANIAKVKVELPKQLPSRLTTLQKACTAAQFNTNPANCPSASKIGFATVRTPILAAPLSGPAIFVSHGGEAFPSLTIVLQGDNVTIDLVGTTFISKAGVTSTTFKTVPDTPFSSFALTLPEGKFSALAANGSLCNATKTVTVKKKVTVKVKGRKKTETRKVKQTRAAPLQMPTEIIAQNGAVIHQVTPIGVTGCPPTRAKAVHAKKGKKKRGKKSKRK